MQKAARDRITLVSSSPRLLSPTARPAAPARALVPPPCTSPPSANPPTSAWARQPAPRGGNPVVLASDRPVDLRTTQKNMDARRTG
ncbi:hypothetical protein [Streptomyces massasporeus]|uniref:hypothetical protein n=1 Tax=Streptomyces massasporeus TaxID=67324 RepID=UPI0033EBFE85